VSRAADLKALERGEVVVLRGDALAGASGARLLELRGAGGRTLHAVFKPPSSEPSPREPGSPALYLREVAAYRLSEAIGLRLVPPTVARTVGGEVGSLQLFVPGMRSLKELQPERPQVSRDVLDRLFAFDHILANVDRCSPGNLLVGPPAPNGQGRPLVAIDHAHAFYEPWAQWVFLTNVKAVLQKVSTSAEPSPEARRWMAAISPKRVEKALLQAGIDADRSAQAARRAMELDTIPLDPTRC
jgi:hypothetical protein